MKVVLDSDLLRKLKKIDVKVRKAFKEKILLFSKNPNDSQLNNHKLKDEYEGYLSINITSDYRAIYKKTQITGADVGYFVDLGTHEQLYKKHKKSVES